jgi:hypothetical protein
MRHEFQHEELKDERKEFRQYDRDEAKMRDKERGQARKAKHTLLRDENTRAPR